MKATFFAFIAYLGSIGEAAVPCFDGYEMHGSTCRPMLKPEFYYGSLGGGVPNDRYPICGPGRLPVTGDGSYSWTTMASSGVPKSSNSTLFGGTEYRYLRDATTTPPVYAYRDLSRCVCIGKTINESIPVANYALLPPLSTTHRILPDTMEVISNQTSDGQARYGMVAIADDNASDGRLGAFYSAGRSKCGCPNFNEIPQPVDPNLPSSADIGVRCVPAVQPGPARVLGHFNPDTHDKPTQSFVMNRGNEPTVDGSPNELVTNIALPLSTLNQNALANYARRIWTCAQPYRLNPSSGACEFQPEYNRCDEGDPTANIPPSEVSPFVTGSSKVQAFENTINKKLAACLNEFGTLGSSVKFDCIDNSIIPYDSFDELWASADENDDGGQPNAFVLMNPAGRTLTGFFTLSGERCEDYSEFVDEIKPGKLTRKNGNWEFTPRGTAIPRPTGGLKGANFLASKLTSMGKRLPQTPLEKHQCPILVRAAAVMTCPKNPLLPAAQRTLEIRSNTGMLLKRRCSVASAVVVHIRAEQVYEIEGAAPMKTYDTIRENNQASAISVSQLTTIKFGPKCPPGTQNLAGSCVY